MDIIKKLEPESSLARERRKFSSADLRAIIIPSLTDQFFTSIVGLTDTLMISYIGEAAVGGVSLVNQLAFLFIFVLSALGGGGGIVVSQSIGRGDREKAGKAAGQFLVVALSFGLMIMAICLLWKRSILSFFFGSIEKDVMDACIVYLTVTAISWPFQGIYSASASIFNAMGKTKIIMKVSLLMNVINVIGNYLGIFVFHMGVLGVAIPTLMGRFTASVVMIAALRREKTPLNVDFRSIFPLSFPLLSLIVSVSLPGATENFLFHFSKVAISSIVSTFGTDAIASYGAAGNFWSMASICSMAMGRCFVTVIGRSTGSGDKEATSFYFRYLMRISFLLALLWNMALLLLSPLILSGFALEGETKILTLELIVIHNVFYALLCTFNSALPNGLRAAGDIKWVMGASIFATVVCRLFFSWLLGIRMNMGVVGIALAMVADWSVKSLLVFFRYRRGVWMKKRLL